MAKYRKVDPRIWNDEKFNSLSMQGKMAFLFMLTHPHMTSLGAMRATIPGLVAELHGVSEKAFREGFLKGMAKVDEKACFVWLPKFIKYNAPESPNVVKAWCSALDLLPECELKNELILHVKDFLLGYAKGFQEAFAEESPKSMPNQEQEQDINTPPTPPKKKPFVLTDYDFPDWLNKKLFFEWAEMRKKIKKPIATENTVKRRLNVLKGLIDIGHDQDRIIEKAIDHNWQDFYEPKNGNGPDDKNCRRSKEITIDQCEGMNA